jgi:fructose-1,6-bisphosphatase I
MEQRYDLGAYLSDLVFEGVIDESLKELVQMYARCSKQIGEAIERGPLDGTWQLAGTANSQGEAQQQLDKLAHSIIMAAAQRKRRNGEVINLLAVVGSEEQPDVEVINLDDGLFVTYVDPLDGSKNVNANATVGMIFSIYQHVIGMPQEQACLRLGAEMVCAGYVAFGPATQLVLTFGEGVDMFTMNRGSGGGYCLTAQDIKIPHTSTEYAVNGARRRKWREPVLRYVEEMEALAEESAEPPSNRWIGTMVADVHRILLHGGIFLYTEPPKIRLLYEANPMAWIIEQAGGAASTGTERILEVRPEKLHHKVPVILGSADEVARLVSYHQQ